MTTLDDIISKVLGKFGESAFLSLRFAVANYKTESERRESLKELDLSDNDIAVVEQRLPFIESYINEREKRFFGSSASSPLSSK